MQMTIAEMNERLKEVREENDGYKSSEETDLIVDIWWEIRELLDKAKIVYERSNQSEAVYLQCVTEVSEYGDIDEYYTVRVAVHNNSLPQDVNYIENDYEDMYHRLEELLKTQQGLYCEL